MSDFNYRLTTVIETTNNEGEPHECKVLSFLQWSRHLLADQEDKAEQLDRIEWTFYNVEVAA